MREMPNCLTVVGIIKPPVPYRELVEVLYSYNLLCDKPCGGFGKMPSGSTILRKGSANIGTTLQSILSKHGFCNRCNISTATLFSIAQSDIEYTITPPIILDKEVLCVECMDKIKHSHKTYQAEVEQATTEKLEKL